MEQISYMHEVNRTVYVLDRVHGSIQRGSVIQVTLLVYFNGVEIVTDKSYIILLVDGTTKKVYEPDMSSEYSVMASQLAAIVEPNYQN